MLPFLAEGRFTGVRLDGVKDLQESDQNKFGPRDYRPNLFVTYWAFRAMIGLLAVPVLFAVVALWLTRGGRIPKARWLSWFALATLPTPFLANSAGWVFTEMGRQPWVVAPNPTGDQMIRLNVADGVSDHSAAVVVVSLATFTVVYAVLAVIWFWLIRRYVVEGPQEHDSEPAAPDPAGRRRGRPAVVRVLRGVSAMGLPELWFVIMATLFLGFFVLEGFDFGVGMLMPFFGRVAKGDPDRHRRAALNTIGPVWDGNEVWLITAAGAMFAAFPDWYATLFSGTLSAAAGDPGFDDPARRRDRVARQDRRPGVAVRWPTSESLSAHGFRRSCGAWFSRCWCMGCRWMPTNRCSSRSATCSTPTRCWAG